MMPDNTLGQQILDLIAGHPTDIGLQQIMMAAATVIVGQSQTSGMTKQAALDWYDAAADYGRAVAEENYGRVVTIRDN